MVEGVHGNVNELIDVASGGVAGDDRGAEAVDGGLDQDVGDRKDRTLQAGGDTDADHFQRLLFIEPQHPQAQAAAVLLTHQASQHQESGDVLGQSRGDGHTGNVQLEKADEDNVADHIDDAGDGQVVEGMLRVADGPEDGRAKVVDHRGGDADEIDAQVEGGQGQNVIGDTDEMEQLRSHSGAEDAGENADDEREQDGRVYRPEHPVGVLAADLPGNKHVGAHGDAEKQVDQQVDHRAVGADGGQGCAAAELAHHHDIGGVDQKLQHTRQHQRNGKQDDLARHRAVAHIDFSTAFHRSVLPFPAGKGALRPSAASGYYTIEAGWGQGSIFTTFYKKISKNP